MYSEARKLHFIEKYLKVKDEGLLVKFEEMIEDETKKKKPNIYELLGMITEEEAEEMEKAIAETGGKIYPDDWK